MIGSEQERGTLERLASVVRGIDGQVRQARERFETRAREFGEQLEATWQGSPTYERVRGLQRRLESQLMETRALLLDRLGLVSRSEVERLSERLEELARRLREVSEQKDTVH